MELLSDYYKRKQSCHYERLRKRDEMSLVLSSHCTTDWSQSTLCGQSKGTHRCSWCSGESRSWCQSNHHMCMWIRFEWMCHFGITVIHSKAYYVHDFRYFIICHMLHHYSLNFVLHVATYLHPPATFYWEVYFLYSTDVMYCRLSYTHNTLHSPGAIQCSSGESCWWRTHWDS